jgi:phosphoribosyl 1,2-cyclic phosphodiesterase
MRLKLCVLASGSSGNCTFIGTEKTRILIDAGLSARKTAERLAEIGERIEEINAICVSHEHGDHIAGIRVLQKNHGMPVYANAGTFEGLGGGITGSRFTTGSPFSIGEFSIHPFPVPHDAADPVGFVFSAGAWSVGVATDIGMVTSALRERLRKCHAVVIEANHDEVLLHEADRPWSLKQRIRGNQGHLSNRAAAALMAEIAGEGLQHLFLAHLSADCNSPQHARTTFESLLAGAGHSHVTVRLTGPECVSEQLILEG